MPTIKERAKQFEIKPRFLARGIAVNRRGILALTAAVKNDTISMSLAELLAIYCDDATIEEHLTEVAAAADYHERRRLAAAIRLAIEEHRAKGLVFHCLHCGGAFDGERMNRRYCSDACRQAAYRTRLHCPSPQPPRPTPARTPGRGRRKPRQRPTSGLPGPRRKPYRPRAEGRPEPPERLPQAES
jgi:hypothetical protein